MNAVQTSCQVEVQRRDKRPVPYRTVRSKQRDIWIFKAPSTIKGNTISSILFKLQNALTRKVEACLTSLRRGSGDFDFGLAPLWCRGVRPSTFFSFFFFNLTYSRWTSSLPSCLWSLRILPSLPSFRVPYDFLSRCKFSTLTTRQPMVELLIHIEVYTTYILDMLYY